MFRMSLPKRSKFKSWVDRKWDEHNYEIRLFEKRPVKRSQQQWFNDNKWYLKKEFQKLKKSVDSK